MHDVVVVGGGVFGLSSALELRARGRSVALLDPGPIPNPLAASTDVSKVVRMEYGADVEYMALAERARDEWLRWNAELFAEPLYHEVGVTMLTRTPMQPAGFEYESFHNLLARGHAPERLDADTIARRFPAWRPGSHVDGFFHRKGGYVESGRVIAELQRIAIERGVALETTQAVDRILVEQGSVRGVHTRAGETIRADVVIVAAGAWTPFLLPELAPAMKVSGHPVFHLRPTGADLTELTPPELVVFTADISATGWYGFPLHPREHVLKVANHGVGKVIDPSRDERVVDDTDTTAMRAFLSDTIPSLLDAEIAFTRRCLYCDTRDEHFWIDRHPETSGLVVAAGGSGHAMKFAPLLGGLVANAIDGDPVDRFRWRELATDTAGAEQARNHRD